MDISLATAKDRLEISSTAIAALQKRFPTRDVTSELLAMHLWLERYPKRRPVNGWRFVDNWLKRAPNRVRPAPVTVFGWWMTDERTVNQGAALGLEPRPGESMAQFRDRISAKMGAAA